MQRRLGYWETFKRLTHDLCNNSESIAAGIEISGDLSFERLQEAIRQVFDSQPFLRARIVQDGDEYYFKFDCSFEDISIVQKQVHSESEWPQLVDQDMNTPFSVHQSLWRLRLLPVSSQNSPKCAIVCSFHHSISDGISIIAFLHQVLSYYAENCTPLHVDSTSGNPSAVEHRLKSSRPISRYKAEIPAPAATPLTKAPYHRFAPLQDRQTKTFPAYLSRKLSELLIAKAKKTGQSTHALLAANMMLTAQKIMDKSIHLNMSTPVSLRPFCRPSINESEIVFCCCCKDTL